MDSPDASKVVLLYPIRLNIISRGVGQADDLRITQPEYIDLIVAVPGDCG